ncbi:MAG: tetratricopeptide repeat protein [Thiobacillus sp.]
MMTKLLSIMFGILFANGALAILPSAIQPNEFAMLPAYCKAKLSDDPADDKLYSGAIGPDWLHIHHYCFALNFTNRFYKTSNPNEKRHYLRGALDNHDYVLTHAAPDFWMRPEIHTEKARQLRAAKRYGEAMGELTRALGINPDYLNAYVVLSDVHMDLNKKSDAVASVEKGLQHGPDNRALQRRYKSLTGKEFVPPEVGSAVSGAPGGGGARQTPEPQSTESPSLTTKTELPQAEEAKSEKASVPSAPSSEIGSPTNPYCRFCP